MFARNKDYYKDKKRARFNRARFVILSGARKREVEGSRYHQIYENPQSRYQSEILRYAQNNIIKKRKDLTFARFLLF